jgi:hypothetical protein
MPITEQQFLAMEGNIENVVDAYFKKEMDLLPKFYKIIKKTSAQFTDYTIGAPGKMSDWTGSVDYDSFEEGYEKQYRPTKKSTGIQVDRDWFEDKEYERIRNKVDNVLYGVKKTLRYESAENFNKATSTTILGPDGQPLASASHRTIPGAPLQSNLGSYELTYAGVEDSQLIMEEWVDDRGDEMLIEGDLVIAGPKQRKNCQKLFGSDKEAYVADNTKNVDKDFKYIIHPLIKGNSWGLANEELMKGGSGFNWFMRRDPRKLERDGATASGDFNTEILSWKAVGRWNKGWTNWFFIYWNSI